MTLSSKFNLKAALLVNTLGCGLELIACAGFTYIPPLLRKSGHSETTMALTLGIGPLLGFIFVPYIGEASDNLKSRYGRRRPFILAFSIVAGLSFIVMPYMKTFLPKTPPGDPGDVSDLFDINAAVPTTTLAIIATCLVILFDFSSQVALSPFGDFAIDNDLLKQLQRMLISSFNLENGTKNDCCYDAKSD
ncbi:proton-associated sugar transporter A-like [Convolutriloba macropyga]|uniref:proton-associated sugar transporter A-like n=1 Tax=Convolutriloba macropyga TaxID=536237 RepID=UPI003F51E83E